MKHKYIQRQKEFEEILELYPELNGIRKSILKIWIVYMGGNPETPRHREIEKIKLFDFLLEIRAKTK
jgi:hypothetical protein